MALRQQNLRHEQIGAGNLILQPGADESYNIIDIRHCLGTSHFLVGFTDRDAIAMLWRYDNATPLFADVVTDNLRPDTTHRLLNKCPGQFPIPVAAGQIFTIPNVGAADEVLVIYDVGDAGDYTRDQHNGTDGADHSWIQKVHYNGGLVWGTQIRMDTMLTPAEFLDFPVRANVAANRRVTVEAIAGIPYMEAAAGAAIGSTERVFWTKNRERISGEVGHGHWFYGQVAGAASLWSALRSTIGHQEPLTCSPAGAAYQILGYEDYKPPLEFGPGDDVDLWVDTVTLGAGGAIAVDQIILMLALTEYRV